jgi:hypothetical protein
MQGLGQLQSVDPESPRSSAERWLRRALGAYLSKAALRTGDTALARKLLADSRTLVEQRATADALSHLASSGHVAPRVVGRALGIVLDVSDENARLRSTAIVGATSRTLGLTQAARSEGSVRLLSETATVPDEVGTALSELAGQGAGILVAGVNEAGANAGFEFASETGIPVVLLTPPARPLARTSSVFVLGAAASDFVGVVETELAARFPAYATVGTEELPCRGTRTNHRFPVADWRKADLQAVLVAGDGACAVEVANAAADAGLRLAFGLGLDAAHSFGVVRSSTVVYATAGQFPMSMEPSKSDAEQGWFAALGHDVAVLASDALQALPVETVRDSDKVARLHQKAGARLREAKGKLWSTERLGFEGTQQLGRVISARWQGAAAR